MGLYCVCKLEEKVNNICISGFVLYFVYFMWSVVNRSMAFLLVVHCSALVTVRKQIGP